MEPKPLCPENRSYDWIQALRSGEIFKSRMNLLDAASTKRPHPLGRLVTGTSEQT